MGTRNLVEVINDNKIKIAQYGQWDGYIEGQGKTIIEFLSNKENILKLKESLKNVKFFTESEEDEKFIELINQSLYNKNTENLNEYKEYFTNFLSRDVGAHILYNIIDKNKNKIGKEIKLQDSSSFKQDNGFCEYYYIINLDNMTLNINDFKTYDITNLPPLEEIIKDFDFIRIDYFSPLQKMNKI